MSEKYLSYHIQTRKAGLKHQSYNLKTLIAEAHALGRIPVISPHFLSGKHNFNKELSTNFDEYYDLKSIRYQEKPVHLIQSKELNISPTRFKPGQIIPPDCIYAIREFPVQEGCSWEYFKSAVEIYYAVNLPYSSEIENLAHKLISLIGNDFAAVHVRRGDVINSLFYKYPRLYWDTKPKNILKKLSSNNSPRKVFIMTNENRKNYFKFNSQKYEFYFSSDLKILNNLRASNNYLLFCVESFVFQKARVRIGTFKDTNPIYHDSLSNHVF